MFLLHNAVYIDYFLFIVKLINEQFNMPVGRMAYNIVQIKSKREKKINYRHEL